MDLRDRPVVLEAGSPRDERRGRRTRLRAVLGVAAAVVVAAAGVVAGSWSVWSAVGTNDPAGTHAPLWFSPPAPVTQDIPAPPRSGDRGRHRGGRHG